MHISNRTYHRVAAIAIMGAVILTGTAQFAQAQATAAPAAQAPATPPAPGAPPEKKYKDQGEYDIYNQTAKDVANPAAQLKDLETWTQKYPVTDYKDERLVYYFQAYQGTEQPAKVLEVGSQLMARDLKNIYSDPKTGPAQILNALYQLSVSLQKLPAPSAEQTAIGEKAARQLQEMIPSFFANKPAGVADAVWTKARTDSEQAAKGALMYPLYLAAKPAADAMNRYAANKDPKKDTSECVTAEAASKKALEQFPESAAVAYQLGRALRCQQAASPEKVPQALYEFARAAALDPTLGGTMDPKTLNTYLDGAYNSFHGSLEGLDQLKTLAKASPLPPADLKIDSVTAIALKKQAELVQKNPQLALWMGIKANLADPNTPQYFETDLKDHDIPPLKGTLLEGKPACRSKELLVTVPLPDQEGNPVAEITLKLDAPLSGKPEVGATIQWKGLPISFTKDPFMLTMEVEKAKLENLKTTPCGPPPAKKAGSKKK